MVDYIKKLKEIDVKDLLKLDYKHLAKELIKKPELVVNIVLIVITLFTCIKIYLSNSAEQIKARREFPLLEKKSEAIEKRDIADKTLKDFIAKIPEEISSVEFTDILTDLAESRKVKINTFSPAREGAENFCTTLSTHMNVTIEGYIALWQFTNDLENLPYSIYINRMSVNQIKEGGDGKKGQSTSEKAPENIATFTADLDITLVQLKKSDA